MHFRRLLEFGGGDSCTNRQLQCNGKVVFKKVYRQGTFSRQKEETSALGRENSLNEMSEKVGESMKGSEGCERLDAMNHKMSVDGLFEEPG